MVTSKRGKRVEAADGDDKLLSPLRHVLVVGGTALEWDELGDEPWTARRNDLAKVVAHAGAMWLTMRPYSAGTPPSSPRTQRMIDVREGCTVIVDPSADGRQRLIDVIEQIRDLPIDAINEAAIAGVLMAPAPVEPDLTIILGEREHLPPSLVWELAYTEIVFVDTQWAVLAAAHVEHAIDEFSRRQRRFGGLK